MALRHYAEFKHKEEQPLSDYCRVRSLDERDGDSPDGYRFRFKFLNENEQGEGRASSFAPKMTTPRRFRSRAQRRCPPPVRKWYQRFRGC